MSKKYYWLKLKEGFFRQKEMKKLRKIAGGDTYTIIYLKMQLLSLKNEGILYFEEIEDTFIEEIALEIDEDIENVKVTIMFLFKYGLLEELNDKEFLLNQTASNIGSETQGAERVRRFRERKKQKKALLGNGGVTNSNTEIDKEIDKEIDVVSEQEDFKKQQQQQVIKKSQEMFNGNVNMSKVMLLCNYIDKGLDADIILYAIQKGKLKVNNQNGAMNYADKTLLNWYNEGKKALSDLTDKKEEETNIKYYGEE